MGSDDRGEWLTLSEAGLRSFCSKNTLTKWLNEGTIPARRFGTRWYVHRRVLADFFACPKQPGDQAK